MRRVLFVSFLSIALAGCVTTGTKVDPSVVSTFRPGVTTLQDAEAKLGQPNQVSTSSDGDTIVIYSFAQGGASGTSYIPVVGAFVGHTDVTTQNCSLEFDHNGKFLRSTMSSGQSSSGLLNHS